MAKPPLEYNYKKYGGQTSYPKPKAYQQTKTNAKKEREDIKLYQELLSEFGEGPNQFSEINSIINKTESVNKGSV